ncbi:MAG: hypothetical protein LBI57_04465 [Helicobacteraceae bacterium]|nr:hypothetical protein [Helicobacteraceae bacterium]
MIIGTFNPDVETNIAAYFYGRSQNYLWRLLPRAFGEESLKTADRAAKRAFCVRRKIDFIDLIAEVSRDRLSDFKDETIDGAITKWTDIDAAIRRAPNLRQVAFTRKTFSGVLHIKRRWLEIKKRYENRFYTQALITPSRIYSEAKQNEWDEFIKSPPEIDRAYSFNRFSLNRSKAV